MTTIERTAYPRFGSSPSKSDLSRLYTPTFREIELAKRNTRGEGQSLAYLLMLKSFQRLGYFPAPEEVPEAIVSHIRARLKLGAEVVASLPTRTRQRYRDSIREYLRVKAYGDEGRRVAAEAVAEAAFSMDDPADLVNVAVEELIKERFELPAFSTLDRLTRHTRYSVNSRLFSRVDKRMTEAMKRSLDALLESARGARTELNLLKEAPKSATRKNLTELQERLVWLESLGDTNSLLEGIPNAKIEHLCAQARTLDASELRDFSIQRRRAMLVCLLHRSKVALRDNLAQMLLKIMAKVHKSGKEALEELHRERRATTEHLMEVLEKILAGAHYHEQDDAALGRRVRQILAEGGGTEALLGASVSLSAHRGGNYLPLLGKFFKGQRATLFKVVRSLLLRPTTDDRALVDAVAFVLDNDRLHRRGQFVAGELDLSFASERWRDLVAADLRGEPVLDRRNLEILVFSYIAEELRTGDLCVEGSEKYADYREQLLSWEECEPMVDQHCRELGLAPTPGGFVAQLKEQLSTTAEEVDRSYPENSSVVISEEGEPVLKKIVGKKPTRSSKMLEAQILERMPERNLIDVLCSGEHHTNWSRYFGPLSGSEPKLDNARQRYLITAFGYGTNMGPVQTARHTRELVSSHMLGYVNRRHITISKLEAAITDVVNAYAKLPLPSVWGSGELAAADGTKVDLYENSLISEYHIRYGGYGGIAYHHIADTYVALFTHFFACGVWEAVYILDGLLRNASEIQPRAVASDT